MLINDSKLVDVVALSDQLCQFPINVHLAYATRENFVGRVIDGYDESASDFCLMTQKAAKALCEVQNELNQRSLGLLVFDAYRPLRAVRDFAAWFLAAPKDAYELERKAIHYPHLAKTDLARLGYVLDSVSKHNFGGTVDLMLIDLNTSKLLNMGACFDYFDEISHPSTPADIIGQEAYDNRMLLSKAMQQQQFLPYEKEFWHFDYFKREVEEPMDFPILAQYKGLGV